MKKIFKFNLPDEQEECQIFEKASDLHCAIFDIKQELFRPARKYGYKDKNLQDLIDKNPSYAVELITELEKILSEILNRYGVE